MENPQAAQAAQPPASGGVGAIIVDIDKKLSLLANAAANSQSMPEGAAEKLAAIRQQFLSVINSLMGEGQVGPGPQGGGAVSQEQGGNPNAIPETMARG